MNDRIEIERGSGNVFADLGLPNPEERLVKATIAIAIVDVVRQRKLAKQRAAAILGLDQLDYSKLVKGQLGEYTVDRLLVFHRPLVFG